MKKNPDIHNRHRIRLRRRYREEGLDHFEAHNALELLLFFSRARCDTNEIAHELISHFGSIPLVFEAPYEELVKVKGVGEITATLIKLVPDITGYYLSQKALEGNTIGSLDDVTAYFIPKFLASTVEEFHIMCLNSKGKIIKCVKICEGTVNAVPVITRMVITEAIKLNAVSIIAAHNHPSGIPLPSSNDTFLTQNLYKGLFHAGIIFEDHIIISGKEYLSLRETGFFNKFPKLDAQTL